MLGHAQTVSNCSADCTAAGRRRRGRSGRDRSATPSPPPTLYRPSHPCRPYWGRIQAVVAPESARVPRSRVRVHPSALPDKLPEPTYPPAPSGVRMIRRAAGVEVSATAAECWCGKYRGWARARGQHQGGPCSGQGRAAMRFSISTRGPVKNGISSRTCSRASVARRSRIRSTMRCSSGASKARIHS